MAEIKMTHLDHGHHIVSAADARRLCGVGSLPAHGRERLVEYEGRHYWLSRTPHEGGLVWCVRPTDWRLVDGRAVLGGP